jgi:uncharacterized protein
VPLSAAPRVAWLSWSADAFRQAARERKPVLLSISAPWSHACREMDRTTWADASIAAIVSEQYVAIRVDSDRRPDINERYNLGGWPTTAFLDADGALLGGGTFVSVDRMPGVLARVRDAFGRGVPPVVAPSDGQAGEHQQPGLSDAEIVNQVLSTFDPEHGGFGREPKFPHVAPVRLALALFADAGDRDVQRIAERTLEAIARGDLHDEIDGGFFRYAAARDWRQPGYEKLLETNGALLGLYAEAHDVLEGGLWSDVVRRTVDYLLTRLADPDGGFYGSEYAPPEYYEATDRASYPVPDVDRTLYADANAIAVSALLAASAALEDDALATTALRSLERVLLACYQPGGGVAHDFDGRPGTRGLLADHVAMINALLDAHGLTEGAPYVMMAEELGHYMLRTMWDAETGSTVDRQPREDDVGLLREPRRPFAVTAEAAIAFARLERASGEPAFRDRASAIIRALAPEAARHGPLAAHYLLAVRANQAR